jgi:DNA gyrase subunit A
MGVRLMNLAAGDSVVAIARNAETAAEDGADPDDNGAGLEDNGAGLEDNGSGQEATE